MSPIRRFVAAWLAAAVSVSLATASFAVTPNGRLQIIQLDVGQGDGAVIITPLGQVAMIDEGQSATTAMGRTVLQQLQALGVTHVDHHFNSHYHLDHLGNFPTVFDSIALDYGWDRGGSYSTGAYMNYVNRLGSRRRTMVRDQVITLDSLSAHPVTIRCVNLNGAGVSTTDENTLSMVLKITYGEFHAVYGGDLGGANSGSYKDIESIVAPQVGGQVEVLKVNHHGSATSTNATWLSTLSPKVALISEGNGNSYGHPTAAALGRLHTANVRTYWTETGAGAAPNPTWDKVAGGQIVISATWEAGGVDTIRNNGTATPFTDTFTNRGSAGDVTAPAVALTSPDGGEIWKAGSSHAITWSATDAVGVSGVDLAYSTDNGTSFPGTIATGLANSGSHSWTVPNTPSSTVRVRVLARDAAGNIGRDSSATGFTIDRWTIAASAGAGGSIVPGGAVPVTQGASQHFSIAPAVGQHVLGLLVDGGPVAPDTTYTFTNVTASHTIAVTFSSDTFPLAVNSVGGGTVTRNPDLESYAYGTSVELDPVPAGGWAFSAWSGDTTGTADPLLLTVLTSRSLIATFLDVTAPLVTLSAPLGGEAWDLGTVHDVTWTATDNAGVDSLNVDYSPNGPAGPWEAVAHGLTNSGTYAWTLSVPASDSALVRVTAYDHARNAASARSPGAFRITTPAATDARGGGPAVLALARPLPNPSPGATLMRFSLPAAGHVRLDVVDVTGRRRGGRDGEFGAGAQQWRWDGRGADGGPVEAGLYFVRLATPWGTRTERLVLLR